MDMEKNGDVVVTLSGRNLADLLFQYLNHGNAGLQRRCGGGFLRIVVEKDEDHYGRARAPGPGGLLAS